MHENAIKNALQAANLPVDHVQESTMPTTVTGCLIFYTGPADPAAAKRALARIGAIKEVVQRQPDIHFAVYGPGRVPAE